MQEAGTDRPADVAIVGAGPAGSAAALRVLALRPDAEVLLLDAAAFPRDKTCGDGISAHVLELIGRLGVPVADWAGPPVPGMRLTSPGGRVVARRCARPNRVVPRAEFDARLVAAATGAGARLVQHRVRSMQVLADRVVLDDRWSARVVIGADGANSTIRRLLGAPPSPATTVAVAVRGYAQGVVDPEALVIEFTRGSRPAYAWAFPLPDGRSNVGFGVFGRRAGGSRADLLAELARLLPDHQPDPGTVRGHQLPLSTGPRWHPDGRVLLAGDAASLVNPLTGEGIYDAVASGALAGEAALHGAGAGAAHRAAMKAAFGRHHRHTALLARLVPRPWFLDAAVAAAARYQSVFDSAVDLGLGPGTASRADLVRVASSALTLGRGRALT
ncbi:geranylgeranyl reductase family [Pseudonocardia thermophila]|uniref:Geranylgeranyl reductase family n=1 Tax=Pseudonocardia thermophila TaxID=1848 RepID=A0A1M6TYQ0_PSETH|nr:NAD(P)/FAD-dependent oxidoreductase [Pseudonocardia thermophila]SHK62076.1 geranylgeranyl reductase family [Pseudonocardia thermophila]